jgi:hypothetical protein
MIFSKKDQRLIAAEAIPKIVKELIKVEPQHQDNVLGGVQMLLGNSKKPTGKPANGTLRYPFEDDKTAGGLAIGIGLERKGKRS